MSNLILFILKKKEGNTMIKKTMIIDLDSTLNQLDVKWISDYNKEYNDNLTREDMACWEIHTYVKPECGKDIYKYLFQPNFFRNLDIQPDAKEVTKWLQQFVDIHIVTAYSASTCVDKVAWVEKHLPHIDSRNIVFCNNKGLIKAHYMIDDGSHNILDFYKTNPCGIPIIYDAPWNRNIGRDFIRCKNWLEIKENCLELFETFY